LSQYSVEMCAASKNCEKFTKNLFLGVQGHLRSLMLIKLKKPVTSTCYDKQHVCTCAGLIEPRGVETWTAEISV